MDESGRFDTLSLRRQHLREQIADSIQQMIAASQLQPGDRLPSERELAKQLGVNRGTLREGLRLLEQRGLVQMQAGSRTYISDFSPKAVADSIERYSVLAGCSYVELTALREILEPAIAALAAQQADADDMARLLQFVERIDAASANDDAEEHATADAGFHEALAIATHNKMIIAVASGLAKVVRAWIGTHTERAWSTEESREGARTHRTVYEAVVARDPEKAREIMTVHMSYAQEWF